MSYILDALKKSESERQNQDLPNINAVHQRPELHPQRKRRIWILAIPAALILNIVGFWFLWDRSPSCLLYTSPSPRDRTRSRMPSSA